MQRIGNLLMIVALLATLGGHWALLQSVAWTTMLAGHLQSESLACSMADTFNGRHPCKICLAIAAAKKSEKQAAFSMSLQKIEYPPLAPKLVIYPPSQFARLNPGDTFAGSFVPPPPTPPPRVTSVG